MRRHTPPVPRPAPYLAFASFGAFWGSWGALLPSIKVESGLSAGQLGTALLCVGLGALPAMLVTGRVVDGRETRVAAGCLALLSATAVLVGVGSQGPVSAASCMLVVGAASGAADVAINSLAGLSERRTARPVLTRAHGVFSVAVVVSSLTMGAIGAAGAGLLASLCLAAATVLALSFVVWLGAARDRPAARRSETGLAASPAAPARLPARVALPFLVLGIVGALAHATENAHQSWGAVLVTDVLASPGLASLAPATFAATAAVTRLSLAPVSRSHPVLLLTGGGAVATAGTVVLATAGSVPVALCGLAVASCGTSMLFPTLLSHGLRSLEPGAAGAATSVVAATAYLGFLAGPAYVGLIAGHAGMRTAFLAVAVLIVVFTLTAGVTGRWVDRLHQVREPGPDRAGARV